MFVLDNFGATILGRWKILFFNTSDRLKLWVSIYLFKTVSIYIDKPVLHAGLLKGWVLILWTFQR